MTNFIFLILHFKLDRDSAAANARQSFGFLYDKINMDGVVDEDGFYEFPFGDLTEDDYSTFKDPRPHGETGSDGQSQDPMGDALTDGRILAELRIGMDLVIVTRKPGKSVDIELGYSAPDRGHLLPDKEFLKIKSSHVNSLLVCLSFGLLVFN